MTETTTETAERRVVTWTAFYQGEERREGSPLEYWIEQSLGNHIEARLGGIQRLVVRLVANSLRRGEMTIDEAANLLGSDGSDFELTE